PRTPRWPGRAPSSGGSPWRGSPVAAEQDVGAAARHVGRDRDGPLTAGLGDDLGLALVVLGVQDLVADSAFLEKLRELLGLLDRDRADERGLAARVALDDVLDDGVELLALRLVDDVRVVHPDERTVRGDDRDVELVDL